MLYRQHPVQGSREVRKRDFRTELLLGYARSHGLKSRDGRAMAPARFAQIVSRYQGEYGYHHLQQGHRWTGVRSLAMAWWRVPVQVKLLALALALALAVAGALGWRPRPSA